jgi:hypothetical protein
MTGPHDSGGDDVAGAGRDLAAGRDPSVTEPTASAAAPSMDGLRLDELSALDPEELALLATLGC